MTVILCLPDQSKSHYNSQVLEPRSCQPSGRAPECQWWACKLLSWLASVIFCICHICYCSYPSQDHHPSTSYFWSSAMCQVLCIQKWVGTNHLYLRPALDTLPSVHASCSLAFSLCVDDIFSGRFYFTALFKITPFFTLALLSRLEHNECLINIYWWLNYWKIRHSSYIQEVHTDKCRRESSSVKIHNDKLSRFFRKIVCKDEIVELSSVVWEAVSQVSGGQREGTVCERSHVHSSVEVHCMQEIPCAQ